MSKILKIALLAVVLTYGFGLAYTYYSNSQFEKKVTFYDLDKNGLIDNKEITKNSIDLAKQQTKRKTLKQGAAILIPVSLIIGLFVYGMAFLFKKMKTIDDNEILYQNNSSKK